LQTWQRPTLPRLETKYHRRWGVSRPSSEWDRVQTPRHNHQVGKTHVLIREAGFHARPQIAADTGNGNDQADRAISTGKLHTLLRFHTRPINVVVFHGSQGNTRFQAGFPLRCLQRLSIPYIATLLCGWRHNRSTRDTSIPVLSY
jgi:hypothetical protein